MGNHSSLSQIKLLMREKCWQRRHLLYVGQDVQATKATCSHLVTEAKMTPQL